MKAAALSARILATAIALAGPGLGAAAAEPNRQGGSQAAISRNAAAMSPGAAVPFGADPSPGALERLGAWGRDWLDAGAASARASYERRPTVSLALGVLTILPAALLGGIVLRWRQRRALDARAARIVIAESATELLGRSPSFREEAHIALMQPARGRLDLGRDLLRIGREDDNDLRLPGADVERYHAIIERASPREFVLHDVSGPDGAGVLLNGARVAFACLKHGDIIEVGAVRARFEAHAT